MAVGQENHLLSVVIGAYDKFTQFISNNLFITSLKHTGILRKLTSNT